MPRISDNISAPAASTKIVAELDEDMRLSAFFGASYPLRIRARINRLREFLAEIERAADAGIGLDWADAVTLPPLEQAMETELALRERLARWGRER